MKTQMTIKQMVKEMLFAATEGKRTAENFAYGMFVIDYLGRYYYRAFFEQKYNALIVGKETARSIFWDIADELRFRGLDNPRDAEMAEYIISLLCNSKPCANR